MKACRLKDVKKFMGRLLGTDTFAPFLLAEAVITTYNTFVIDGHMVNEFFTGDIHDDGVLPPYEFSQWTDMRNLCFDLIKGKRTPVNFKLTLHLKPELVSEGIFLSGALGREVAADEIESLSSSMAIREQETDWGIFHYEF